VGSGTRCPPETNDAPLLPAGERRRRTAAQILGVGLRIESSSTIAFFGHDKALGLSTIHNTHLSRLCRPTKVLQPYETLDCDQARRHAAHPPRRPVRALTAGECRCNDDCCCAFTMRPRGKPHRIPRRAPRITSPGGHSQRDGDRACLLALVSPEPTCACSPSFLPSKRGDKSKQVRIRQLSCQREAPRPTASPPSSLSEVLMGVFRGKWQRSYRPTFARRRVADAHDPRRGEVC
jgi:hypothetical protein